MKVKLTLKYPRSSSIFLEEEFPDGTEKEEIAERFSEVLTSKYTETKNLDARARRRYKFGQYKVILNILETR